VNNYNITHFLTACILIVSSTGLSAAKTAKDATGTWDYKAAVLPSLVREIPGILDDQETTSGRFGKGIWIVQDQNIIFPLAVAWATKNKANPYYHDERVLKAVMAGGDALIDAQDKRGMWVFRKKDDSTWGDIYMPWTYSRWIRAYGLIRDAMPAERRAHWEKALLLGFNGIADNEFTSGVQNIPAHHAMAIYHAGQLFKRPDWMKLGSTFMHQVVAEQRPDGYWTEGVGPVVGYNFVYLDAIGVYYSYSRDASVLDALRRGAQFHAYCTYPDGSSVETVDQRQVYTGRVAFGNVGFTMTPLGRAYMRRQWGKISHRKDPVGADVAAELLLHGEEGPSDPNLRPLGSSFHHVFEDGKAVLHDQGPWFTCLAAYRGPVPTSRWIQDTQDLVSLFSEKAGLIVGGGHTHLQPLWSTFTLGDTSLLKHKPGDRDPNFVPPPGLWHVPDEAELVTGTLGLRAVYNGVTFSVDVNCSDTQKAKLTYSLEGDTTYSAQAHVPLIVKVGESWRTESGLHGTLSEEPLSLPREKTGAWIEHHGWRVSIPEDATITWPALPHNQYVIDGHAGIAEGRMVISIPLNKNHRQVVSVSVARPAGKK
jgi:hypothetical protein